MKLVQEVRRRYKNNVELLPKVLKKRGDYVVISYIRRGWFHDVSTEGEVWKTSARSQKVQTEAMNAYAWENSPVQSP